MQSAEKVPLVQRRAQLERRLLELGVRLAAIDEALEVRHDPDWAEQAVEREGDEVLEATGGAGLVELRQIHAALERIDAGVYGTCVRCGNEIGEARLDALPWTPICRECAR